MNSKSIYDSFREFISESGCGLPNEIIADGKIHRYHIDGHKTHSKNGWYILCSNSEFYSGAFGDWTTDEKYKWSNFDVNLFNSTEVNVHSEMINKAYEQIKTEKEATHLECIKKSIDIWLSAKQADDNHPYLAFKQVLPHGIKDHNGSLVIPVYDIEKNIHGLQFINQEGLKRFIPGTNKKGHFFTIGDVTLGTVCIAEGFATAATINQVTNYPVAVCFDAGNMPAVAKALRKELPNVAIICCADNDRFKQKNIGIEKAQEATKIVQGHIAIPFFKTNQGTDFNDLYLSEGNEAVLACFSHLDFRSHKLNAEYFPYEWLIAPPPPIQFSIDPLAPIGAVTLLVATGGVGKTFLALRMAVYTCLGLDILGAKTCGGKVAYMSLEDPKRQMQSRLYHLIRQLPEAVKKREAELTTKFMIIDRYGIETHVATNNNGEVQIAQIVDDLIKVLKDNEIRCLFVDTLVRSHSVNENDNAQMGAVLVSYEKIANEANCSVILLHHVPKNLEHKTQAARGASSITDNARSSILIERACSKDSDLFSDEDIKEAIINNRLLKVTHNKHNYSAKHATQWLEIMDNGVPVEKKPLADDRVEDEIRYDELQKWWGTIWKSAPITITNINDNVNSIRPIGTTHGKKKYESALNWAIKCNLATTTIAPSEGSKNTKARYFILSPRVNPLLQFNNQSI